MVETVLRLKNVMAVVDILIVAVILYWFMLMFKGTRAEKMIWGLAVIVILYFVSHSVELLTLHWILNNFLGSIVIFIIVVFQQDIRRALVHVGKPFSTRDFFGSRELTEDVVKAVSSMSRSRTGGLIVIERGIDLIGFLEVGVEVDAKVSKELILSIFNQSSPVHDGAVIIRGGRIYKAGCILPLTDRELAKSMGTRHRAAIGLSEETDAAIIVVSEETGEITLVVEDVLTAGITPERLLEELGRLFSVKKSNGRVSIFPGQAGR